ncbi:MAG: glycosyltransferase, partial [Acetobacteraceae bacterium]|nr:glycosyltransferase [Acetobacteraceae bacterium]
MRGGEAGGAAPLLLHVFSTFAVGGAQMRFATLANHFGGAFRHAIVALDGNVACCSLLDPALDVRFVPVEARKGDTLGNRRRFRAVLRALRPDALVTANWGCIEWAMANTPALVRHIHMEDGFGPEERERQLPRRVWTRRLLLRGATVMVPSRVLWRLAAEVWRLPRRGLRYIPNAVDLARFAVPQRDAAAVPVIGTVAALRPEKNIALLIRVFARMRAAMPGMACRLVIAGDGGERAALERMAAALGVAEAVTFAGHIGDTPSLYAGFDVYALTSDTEQMPLTVLEAMAAGLPVAATDVGDVRAMLAQENGRLVVPVADEAGLAGALAALVGDARLRAGLGAANRLRAEAEYGQEAMFAAWRALFSGTLPP